MTVQNKCIDSFNVQVHNNMLLELMSHRPSWIVRKGNTIFLILGCCFVLLCWNIKYPDIVMGTVRFLPSNYSGQTHLRAEIIVTPDNRDRIKLGQKVVIKMDAYPPKETVYLTGVISYVSTILSINDSFIIRADFPNNRDRVASLGEKPVFPAEIIVGNRRILNNVTEELRKMW